MRTTAPLLAAVALLFAACSSDERPAAGTSAAAPAASAPADTTVVETTVPGTNEPETTTPDTAPDTAAPAEAAMDVSVMGLWSGPEFDSFDTIMSTWEADTGGTVDWTGARDLTAELTKQIEAGTPPDIAVLPNVGLMHELAADGRLVPLPTVLDGDQLQADYSPAWLDLGSHDGELYGIFYKVNDKSTIWYAPKAFAAAGYQVPASWDEMIALADTMVADGRTPFSVVAPKLPGGGGWALTDWVADIVLNACGAERYDQWVAGEIPWTDPCIVESFQRFETIVQTPGYVLGGADGILRTGDAEGSYPMYTDPPGAYMYHLSSFAQAFIAGRYPDLVPGDDYDTFPFPTIDPANAGSLTIGADVVVMLNDTPAARSFMSYLAGPDSQQAWIELGGFTSVNLSVPIDAYADPVAKATAEQLAAATVVRFGAGDTMPSAVQQAWWKAMVELVKDPTQLDAVLQSLTETAADTGP